MPATSLETARNFDPIQSRLVRKALKSREKEETKKRKRSLEVKRLQALMPSLREAFIELTNVSIRAIHDIEGGRYVPTADYNFGYSIPIEDQEPVEVELLVRAVNEPSGPSVQQISYFSFGSSDSPERLTTLDGKLPVLRHKYRRASLGYEFARRPAKANHIEEHRDLARLLTLGVAKGLVHVTRK